MGLGIGKYCERCGNQLSYDNMEFTEKSAGEKYDLCGTCAKIVAFDEKLRQERLNE